MFELSTKKRVKEAAQGLLTKLVESLNDKKDDDTPPAPPPKPYATPSPAAVPDLVQPFAVMNMSGARPPPAAGSPGFVGGFHPTQVPEPGSPMRPTMHSAYSAPPPAMPTPFGSEQQSLTMQMALDPNVTLPHRPSSTPAKPSSKPSSSTPAKPPKQTPLTPTKPSKPGATPTKPTKSSKNSAAQTPTKVTPPSTASSSAPSTPSAAGGKPGQVKCSGVTKAGKPCTRYVKTAPALDAGDDSDEGAQLERFCFQHTKEILGPSGCYARKNGEWVEFADWIPGYLQSETQLALRIEMERSRSPSDVDGYIYTFEIRDDDEENIKLKVGRAVNLVKRIDQWGKQCGSKEQVLRGYYPGPEAGGADENAATLMKGRVRAGEKAPCCHRLERLIHLELADLSATCAYLDPAWPEIDALPSPPSGKAPAKRERCEDCGSMHKEIFEFQKWTKGGNKNKEWERIVKPVIERWGMFVELYL